MNWIAISIAGLTMGIAGSLHCIGMCGPIALGISGNADNRTTYLRNIALYNSGRTISYAIMGILIGFVGNRFALSGYQQILSIISGIIILIVFANKYFVPNKSIQWSSWNYKIKQLLSNALKRKNTILHPFEIGLINAWLPCGLVYLALATALASGNTWTGAWFMFFFGMGTTPLMAMLMFAGNSISISFRNKIKSWIPSFILITASLLILRGMNLGIPYVSPSVDIAHNCVSKCCHR